MLKRIALGGVFLLAFGFTMSSVLAGNAPPAPARDKSGTKTSPAPQPKGWCWPPGVPC
jgi:hypothetical protein